MDDAFESRDETFEDYCSDLEIQQQRDGDRAYAVIAPMCVAPFTVVTS